MSALTLMMPTGILLTGWSVKTLGDNMTRIIKPYMAVLLLLVLLFGTAGAIERVAKRLNFLELSAGYVDPVGNVGGVMSVPRSDIPGNFFRSSLDAADVYKSSYTLGVGLGQIYSGRLMWGLGFRYTRHNLRDTIQAGGITAVAVDKPDLNQYDIELNLNYYLVDPSRSVFAPYAGIGVAAGILTASWDDEFASESETKALGALNFGFDLRLWQSENGRDMVALVSQNRYDILASEERPKYLTIGGALRFYIRP